jgi:ABC-type transport system involved in multi-copper enzyme maturation permease subunit
MTSPQVVYLLRWIIGNTFRQAMASSVFWLLLGFSALAIVFCLGLSVEGADNLRPEDDFLYHPKTDEPLTGPTNDLGSMSLFFGAFTVSLPRDRESGVHLIQVILGSWLAGGVGLLVMLVWTAGFIPEALQPENASVQFAKPVPRWLFAAGAYVGVLCFVAFHAIVFFLGTWLAMSARTGVWLPGYLLGLPLLVIHFAAIYSVSVLLGVWTRSTVAAALGSILFWVVCLMVNDGRHAAVALPQLSPQSPPLSSLSLFVIEATYWVLPKPADFFHILGQALSAQSHMATASRAPEFTAVESMGRFAAGAAIWTTLLFSALPLVWAGRRLNKIDY